MIYVVFLLCFRDHVQELSPFAIKLNVVLNILKMQIKLCKHQIGQRLSGFLQKNACIYICTHTNLDYIAEQRSLSNAEAVESHRRIKKLLQTPTEVKEVFKVLIYAKDDIQPLIDGSTHRTVETLNLNLVFVIYLSF